MSLKKEHTIFKILTFLLVLTLLVPAAAKLGHVFEHHKHEVCKGGDTTHIHKVDLDCDFQKFNLNTNFLFTSNYIQLVKLTSKNSIPSLTYEVPTNHQQLPLFLRGPPILV